MGGQGYYNQPQMGARPMPFVSGMSYGQPPPGALVVRPGDPRIGEYYVKDYMMLCVISDYSGIGGRLCMNCGGDGIVECGFLFLDTETCPACNGKLIILLSEKPPKLTIDTIGTGRVFY